MLIYLPPLASVLYASQGQSAFPQLCALILNEDGTERHKNVRVHLEHRMSISIESTSCMF